RTHDGLVVADGVEVHATQGIRFPAGRRGAYTLSLRLSLCAGTWAGDVRRRNPGDSGKPDLQAFVRSERSGRHYHRTDSGRRWLCAGAEVFPARTAAHLPSTWDFADCG